MARGNTTFLYKNYLVECSLFKNKRKLNELYSNRVNERILYFIS